MVQIYYMLAVLLTLPLVWFFTPLFMGLWEGKDKIENMAIIKDTTTHIVQLEGNPPTFLENAIAQTFTSNMRLAQTFSEEQAFEEGKALIALGYSVYVCKVVCKRYLPWYLRLPCAAALFLINKLEKFRAKV